MCSIMGSGWPGQVDGIGGGIGPLSKAVTVGRSTEDVDADVTFGFMQVGVDEKRLDASHGDCFNMLSGVGPFAVARGLVPAPRGDTAVRVRSLQTGILARQTFEATRPGAPVRVRTRVVNCGGSTTGALLPAAGAATTAFDLDGALLTVSIVDFARVLVIVDAASVGVDVDSDAADARLCAKLERVRRKAAIAAGLGDCVGRDSPKLACVAPASDSVLRVWYWVNPGRAEPHPTLAITAAGCLAAACATPGTVAARVAGDRADGSHGRAYRFEHGQGYREVALCASAAGVPDAVEYANDVRLIADGALYPHPPA